MKLTIKEVLEKGIAAHREGKLVDADRYYTAILKVQPKNPDANHNIGILAVGIGKTTESIPFFQNCSI